MTSFTVKQVVLPLKQAFLTVLEGILTKVKQVVLLLKAISLQLRGTILCQGAAVPVVVKDINLHKSITNLSVIAWRILFLLDYCRFLSLKIQGLKKKIFMYHLRRFMFLIAAVTITTRSIPCFEINESKNTVLSVALLWESVPRAERRFAILKNGQGETKNCAFLRVCGHNGLICIKNETFFDIYSSKSVAQFRKSSYLCIVKKIQRLF